MESKEQRAKSKEHFGFTLIEMLMVVSVLGIVMVTGGGILFSTLRANKKSESLSKVKQSGDYALGSMSRMIRNAQEILANDDGQTCENSMSKIKFQSADGGVTQLICNTGINGYIASNAASLTTTGENLDLSSCSFSCVPSPSRDGPPSVIIEFRLEQSAGGVVEESVGADFDTTVSLRTY